MQRRDFLRLASSAGVVIAPWALIPEANRPRQSIAGMEVISVRRVEDAVARLRDIE